MTAAAIEVPRMPFPSAAALRLPGSKSEASRLAVAAAGSGRIVRISGVTPADDVLRLVDGLLALGYHARFVDSDRRVLEVGPREADAPRTGELWCGNAGAALRFLVSLAAVTPGEWRLDGDAAMRRRPIEPLAAAWRQLGTAIETTAGCPPVRVRGDAPRGGTVAVDASASSQFVSSLLLVGAGLPLGLDLRFGDLASRAYAALTVATLARLGIAALLESGRARVAPGYGVVPGNVEVGADWSAMGVWTCLNHLTGAAVTATNLVRNSGQADERLAAVLGAMPRRGAHEIDVGALPDQFPNLTIVAALRAGHTRLVGAPHLRFKECDRIAVMARELSRLGVQATPLPDGLAVRGGGPIGNGTVDPESDHRIAMAFALLGLVRGGIAVAAPDCVAKSYPGFWNDLAEVRSRHRPIAIVGMRGAGKSTFGQALAGRLGSEFVDTDEMFAAAHGAIAAFVAAHDWPAFRRIEAQLVAAALRPGRVIATGGGAIEDEATRSALRDRAVVLWVDTPPDLLRARLIGGPPRPSLTGRPAADEVSDVLSRRRPLYAATAHRRIDGAAAIDAQIAAATAG